MPYILRDIENANLGWLFYKKYFDGRNVKRDERQEEANRNRDTLENRNYTLMQRVYAECRHYFNTDAPHGFSLYTSYPGLLIGSGYTHEYPDNENYPDKNDAFKIGFFFDHATGMPCLPGHSVKGVLRSAFPNHKGEKYIREKADLIVHLLGEQGINCEERFNAYLAEKRISGISFSNTTFVLLLGEIMFEGNEPAKYNREFEYTQLPLSKKDIFHDAYIASGGKDNFFLASDYITPHEKPLKDPKPIRFLKLLPKISIQFQFELKDNLISKTDKENLFKHILLTLGVGAKTNVGYGQLTTSPCLNERIAVIHTEFQQYTLPGEGVFAASADTKGNILKAIVKEVKSEIEYRIEAFAGDKSLGIFPLMSKEYALEQNQDIAVIIKGITKGKITSLKLYITEL